MKKAKSFPLQDSLLQRKKKKYIYTYIHVFVLHDTESLLAFFICGYQYFTGSLWLWLTEGKGFHKKVNWFAQSHQSHAADKVWELNSDFLTSNLVSCLQRIHKWKFSQDQIYSVHTLFITFILKPCNRTG